MCGRSHARPAPEQLVETADIVVVGGGIAGLAVAHQLASAGVRRVVLLETEPSLASHASGRNAAIFLPIGHGPTSTWLAARQQILLDALFDGEASWLRRTGAVVVSSDAAALDSVAADARAQGHRAEMLSAAELRRHVPVLDGGDAPGGALLPESGVLDTHALLSALTRGARDCGVAVRTGTGVAGFLSHRDRVEGVVLEGGARLASGQVVLAAGAWARALGELCGASLPLVSYRRHLAWLAGTGGGTGGGPVVWRLEDEVYFRPESAGVLASPCDQEPWPAGVPPVEPRSVEALGRKLARTAPVLATLPLRRAWACLRTFASDRAPVAGRDPGIEGLSWLAGLGGQGMTVGVAAAEVTVASVLGRPHGHADALSPARFGASRPGR